MGTQPVHRGPRKHRSSAQHYSLGVGILPRTTGPAAVGLSPLVPILLKEHLLYVGVTSMS